MSEWKLTDEEEPTPYEAVLVLIGNKLIPKIAKFDSACHDWDVEGVGSIGVRAVKYWMEIPKLPEIKAGAK
jgi:hypothetical protein